MTEGSSPHARGARVEGLRRAPIPGIIPACAGSTSDTGYFHVTLRDHPRMRGEHVPIIVPSAKPMGSSPHARGALEVELPTELMKGIIPACAGSTQTSTRLASSAGDHPRMRGEHGRNTKVAFYGYGSSPHARGAPVDVDAPLVGLGIIPACAGSTKRGSDSLAARRDHPRMRGEHEVSESS